MAEHHKALELAIANGINLVDTSANYTDGGSEKLIGNVLKNAFGKCEILPDELVIVSKGGYIQGGNLKTAYEKEESGKPYPETVKCSPDLWHSIHPDFLYGQMTGSLQGLQLKKIDV
jgi:aryl-alcohol dehydrogenase-like predicted oxidoreductase